LPQWSTAARERRCGKHRGRARLRRRRRFLLPAGADPDRDRGPGRGLGGRRGDPRAAPGRRLPADLAQGELTLKDMTIRAMRKTHALALALALAVGASLCFAAAAQALPAKFWGAVPQSGLSAEQFERISRGGVESVRVA